MPNGFTGFDTGLGLCLLFAAPALSGCASYPPLDRGAEAQEAVPTQGPLVLAARLQHGDAEPVKVRAEVRPTEARVREVRLVFQEAPIELRMVQIGESDWEVTIPPSRLKQLSIPGQSAVYHARVIARDESGILSVANPVIQLTVEAVG